MQRRKAPAQPPGCKDEGFCDVTYSYNPSGSWPRARLHRDDATVDQLARHIFQRTAIKDSPTPLRAFVQGTQFQVRVWRALLKIQRGTGISYGGLATIIGQSAAARAVGSAAGQNLLAYLIPCHRVIRKMGVLGDYRWGKVRKQAILAWENSIDFTSTRVNSI